jgi:hypothetical protein
LGKVLGTVDGFSDLGLLSAQLGELLRRSRRALAPQYQLRRPAWREGLPRRRGQRCPGGRPWACRKRRA